MVKRPLSITILGLIYIVTGIGGFILHLRDFSAQQPFPFGNILIEAVSILAVVSGVYLLRQQNWARWLAFAWMVFHVIISVLHPLSQLILHSVLCVLIGFLLFRPVATNYFRPVRSLD